MPPYISGAVALKFCDSCQDFCFTLLAFFFLPQGGVVCVWKADARGNMAPSVQYRRKNSAVTAAVYCSGPAHSADALAQVGDEIPLSFST